MGQHDYFEALCARPEHWRSASLRSDVQLSPPGVVLDPVMDAARVTIPPFYLSDALDGPITETQTTLPINTGTASMYPNGRVFKMGREIVKVVTRLSATAIEVTRGAFGTTPSPHATGTFIYHATNSLRNQVRVRLGTEDGHDYFATWDVYFGDSFRGIRLPHKAFQFSNGGQDGNAIWFENQVLYGEPGHSFAAHHYRSYNKDGGPADWTMSTGDQVGPGTWVNPLRPQTDFSVAHGLWTRFFVRFRQRLNDYDLVSAWAADEVRDPVPVCADLRVSVRPIGKTPNSIHSFWIEFNSSDNTFLRTDQRDLVAFVRNFVVLRDVDDVSPFLIRPEAGAPIPPPWRPRAPRHLRVS